MGIKEVSLYSTLYMHNNDKGPTEAVTIKKKKQRICVWMEFQWKAQ